MAGPQPLGFGVPTYNDEIQDLVDAELTSHEPRIPHFFKGILYPTAGEPMFVDIPPRLGCDDVKSPYDLDVLWWIGVGGGPQASSVDQDATSLTVKYWPLDDPKPLKRSYTLFCAPQASAGLTAAQSAHPLNSLVNDMTTLPGDGWRGNILVTKSGAHFGKKDKYAMGVTSMSERDMYVAESIVRCVVQEGMLGRDSAPFFAA